MRGLLEPEDSCEKKLEKTIQNTLSFIKSSCKAANFRHHEGRNGLVVTHVDLMMEQKDDQRP